MTFLDLVIVLDLIMTSFMVPQSTILTPPPPPTLSMNLPMKKKYNFYFLFENLNLINHDNLNIPSIIEEEIIEELPCHL